MAALLLVLLQVATLLLVTRAILNWFNPAPESGPDWFRRSVNRLTDPVVLPQPRGIDLSVLALLLGINLVAVPIVGGL